MKKKGVGPPWKREEGLQEHVRMGSDTAADAVQQHGQFSSKQSL